MGADQHFDWLGSAASALDWWHDAGVDMLVDDVPRDWLLPPTLASTADPAVQAPQSPPTVLAETLVEFMAWRSGGGSPEAAWRGAAIAASGPADADIMVLVDCPDREDDAAGLLMAGPTGVLFDRMLAAIGLSRAAIHLAAVCAKRPVAGRMPGEIEARLGELSRHHVGLVAPKRLLVMGNAASRAILGAELLNSRGYLHSFNHKAGQVGVVASFHPRFLLEKPAAKADAWKDLQLLMGEKSA